MATNGAQHPVLNCAVIYFIRAEQLHGTCLFFYPAHSMRGVSREGGIQRSGPPLSGLFFGSFFGQAKKERKL